MATVGTPLPSPQIHFFGLASLDLLLSNNQPTTADVEGDPSDTTIVAGNRKSTIDVSSVAQNLDLVTSTLHVQGSGQTTVNLYDQANRDETDFGDPDLYAFTWDAVTRTGYTFTPSVFTLLYTDLAALNVWDASDLGGTNRFPAHAGNTIQIQGTGLDSSNLTATGTAVYLTPLTVHSGTAKDQITVTLPSIDDQNLLDDVLATFPTTNTHLIGNVTIDGAGGNLTVDGSGITDQYITNAIGIGSKYTETNVMGFTVTGQEVTTDDEDTQVAEYVNTQPPPHGWPSGKPNKVVGIAKSSYDLSSSITYSDVASLTVKGAPVNTAFNVQSTASGTPVTITAEQGTTNTVTTTSNSMTVVTSPSTNVFDVGNASHSLDDIQGALTVSAQGNNESLTVNDQGNTAVTTYTLTATTLARTHAATIHFSGLSTAQSSIGINGGSNNDSYTLDGAPSGTTVSITGGSGNDTIVLWPGGIVTGTLDGGGGTNSLEYFNFVPTTVNLQTHTATDIAEFANIQAFDAGDPKADTFVGANTTNYWQITAEDEGIVNSIAFVGFGNLTGGTGKDTFVIESVVNGLIDGGGGTNGIEFFVNVPVTVNLQTETATDTGGFANLQSFIGSAMIADTLIGPNTTSTWTITAANEGTLNAMTFSGFANLLGGTAMDTFNFGAIGGISGKINGGGGGDWLDYSAYGNAVTVNLALGTATAVDGGVSKIQNVRGGSGVDNLTGNSQGNILIGGGGDSTINGGTGRSILIAGTGNDLIGGTGSDSVTGGSGSDILIGGYTSYDSSSLANDLALESILSEWQSPDSYVARISKIKSGVGSGLSDKLVWGSTVHDNASAVANTLTGSGALNWFLANLAHTTINKNGTEQLN